ncbi:MAG TPA: class I SAM-dependent methyltransferase [Terriglobales bacterium]|nr:class I SAM-dependent methyltransferase [Terriglobales bacterium]
MATPIANSLRSDSAVLPERLPVAPESGAADREPWTKRLFTNVARRCKNNSFFFPAAVRGFRTLQKFGFNVTPNHFYWPVPDVAELERREWPIYAAPPGCNFRMREQVELVKNVSSHYVPELNWSVTETPDCYHYQNGFFECVDAEIAYCMVRHRKPRRIIEIGSGYSTRVMAQALRANFERDGVRGDLITVDPYPERLPKDGLGDVVTVVPERVQRLDLSLFEMLGPDDILFIDSSHVVAVGSDVVREYLQILPRLNPGVLVHVHDIFLPSDYPRSAVLENLWFWSEQYLLQAFLTFNPEFEVLWSASAMQLSHAQLLEKSFPNWSNSYSNMPPAKRRFVPTIDGRRVWPSSFWMRRIPK